MRKIFLSAVCSALVLFSPCFAEALPLPTPAPTAATSIPVHIPTYVKIGNCYHLDNTVAFGGPVQNQCGSPVATPGPSGPTADMKALAKYVNFGEVNINNMLGLRMGGIKGVFYTDPFIIHATTTYPGLSRSIGGGTTTTYCTYNLPSFVLLTNAGGYGSPFNAPNYNNTGTINQCTNLNYYGSVFGDVNPNAQNFWEQVFENAIAFSPVSGLGGFNQNSYAYKSGVDDIRQDDADYPGDRFDNTYICQGSPVSQGTSGTGSATSCATYGNQTAATRAQNPYWTLHPYPYFMDKNWVTGIQGMFRMPSEFGAKTIFNDYTNPLFYQYFNNMDHSNVEAGECEGCFTRLTGTFWDEGTWQDHVNAEIVAESYNVKFQSFNPGGETTVNDSIMDYASLMMGMIDPSLTITTDQIGGSGTLNSTLPITPLVYLVPTQPINQPSKYVFDPISVNYQPGSLSPATTYGVGTLKQSGGTYLREFSACYNGQPTTPTVPKTPVNIGGCAIVVVPHGASSPTMPTTVGTYTHTATYTGAGIIQETGFGGGDTGLLSVVGSAPPAAGASLSADTAYILTP